MLAIIGGNPMRFVPFVDLYHRALNALEAPELPVGVHSPGYVADSDEQARDELWPYMKQMRDRIGAERGDGGRCNGHSSTMMPDLTGPSMSDRRRRWPARSPVRPKRSV